VFFNDDTAAGMQTFRDTVTAADAAYNADNPGATQQSTVFSIDITSSTGSSFSVTENGQTIYVTTSRGGSPALNASDGDEGSDGFTEWGVNYTPGDFNDVIADGYNISFFADSALTTPHYVNAAGLFTSNWGTCCAVNNTTPDGSTANSSQIYMLFNGSTPLLVGGIDQTIPGEEHFVAAIDDSNSFSSVTLVPNGSGEAFGAGGTLVFSTVQIDSVPAGSSVVTVGTPDIEEPRTVQELADGDVNPVFDGGTLVADADTTVNEDLTINSTGGTIDTDGFNATFTGDLTDTGGQSGGLTKTGDGTLALEGANSFSGGLNIAGGTIAAAGDENLGTGTITIDNATLAVTADGDIDNSVNLTHANATVGTGDNDVALSGTVSGTGALNKSGAGTLTLSGVNTFTGGLAIGEGTVEAAGDQNLGAGTITIDNATLAVTAGGDIDNNVDLTHANATVGTGDNDVALSGTVSGAGALNKSGSGTLTLAGTNDFEGGLAINGGTVAAAGDQNLGAGTITIDNATLAVTADGAIDNSVSLTHENATVGTGDNDVALSGTVSGAGALNKSGSGTLTLAGTNDFEGGLAINGGTVAAAGDANVGTGTITIDNATLAVTAGGAIDNDVNLTHANATVGTGDNNVGLTGDIGGTGALNKSGAGTLTLVGTNDFAGGLAINGGTVVAAGGANVGTGAISIGNAALVVTADGDIDNGVALSSAQSTVNIGNNDVALSGPVSGAGTLNKSGAGTLTLAGTNGFAGGLAINDGTVRAAGDANVGTGTIRIGNATLAVTADGDIDNGVALNSAASTVNTGGNDVALSGAVSGNGTLNKSGAGTLTLAGANDFAGDLAINGGTVRAAGDANVGTGTIRVGNATLAVAADGDIDNVVALSSAASTVNTGGNDVALFGVVSGEGTLNKTGSGTLTLAGANDFAGGLAIDDGTVRAAGDANVGTGAISIGNATLAVTADGTIDNGVALSSGQSTVNTGGNNVALSGAVSGAGTLNKTGSGMLLLNGTNSQAATIVRGGTLIAATNEALGASDGDLTIGADSRFLTGQNMAISQRLHVAGDNAVFDTGANNVVLTGGADGNSCLNKRGSGRLSLQSAASNDIGACVFEGTLSFNDEFDGKVWVYDGGVASGSGEIDGNMDVYGVLAPGNSPGQLTINGSVTQFAGSTLSLDIDGRTAGNGAGFHDQLILAGADSVFTAGGTIAPIVRDITGDATNSYTPAIGSRHTVVIAEGGVTGTFDSILQPTSGMIGTSRFDVIYNPRNIILYVTPSDFGTMFGSGSMRNAAAVGAAIDDFRASPGAITAGAGGALLSGLYPLNEVAVRRALEQASGGIHAAATDSVMQTTRAAQASVSDRLNMAVHPETPLSRRIWGTITHDVNKVKGDEYGQGYRAGAMNFIIGADRAFGENVVAGLAFAYGRGETSTDSAGSAVAKSYHGILYGKYDTASWYTNAMVSVGVDRYEVDRAVQLADQIVELYGKNDGHTVAGDVEAGYKVRFGQATLTPAVGVSYGQVNRDEFTESGRALAALTFDDDDRRSVVGRAGARLSTIYATQGMAFMPYAAAFATHEMDEPSATLTPSLHGESFSITAPNPGRTAARLDAGMDVMLNPEVTLSFNYRYGDAGNLSRNAVSGGLSIRW
tara:strand:+ start:139252 stop:144159 length:4908 start_codon:yes stop_codon:yes gene_type:complete